MIYTRTVNTLRNRADHVCTFEFKNISFSLLHLGRPHYIIYRNEDLTPEQKMWEDVKIVCEVNNINDRNYISICVRKQFPEYTEFAKDLEQHILKLIKEYQDVNSVIKSEL